MQNLPSAAAGLPSITASESDEDMVTDCLNFLLDEVTVLAAKSELLLVRFIFSFSEDDRKILIVTFLTRWQFLS
eukprot:scaffold2582_cov106-Skeletonema_dohrnii-CCMP3373.AAC.10